ncbi:MAG: HAD family hydrolase [Lachnospiraceae bacterium]|nr:HAD family hydrolase [Lachnospiraceae bacterium]
MKEYRNYIFDLYGTLVDIDVDETDRKLWEHMCRFYGYYGALYEADELRRAYSLSVQDRNDQVKKEYAVKYRHESHPEILYEEVFGGLYADKGIVPDQQLILHTAQMFRACSVKEIRLYAHAKELLEALRAAGKKVYLLSNAQRIFTEYEMRCLGIWDLFDGIQISSDHGCKKPDERFFRILLERFSLKPEESLMIGNNMYDDIAGASRVGMESFYIHSALSPREQEDSTSQDIRADYVMRRMNLRQLQNRLLP